MFNVRAIGLGMLVGLACGAGLVATTSTARAATLTYDFSGTLAQPYNGASTFSGSFTYNTDLPLNPAVQPMPGWSYYTGVPTNPSEPVVSLSFKLGDLSSTSLGTVDNTQVVMLHNAANDGFYLDQHYAGASGGYGLLANIGMVNDNTVARGPFTSTSLPTSLDPASFSMGAQLDLTGIDPRTGQWITLVGHITSFNGKPVSPPPQIPEPASLLIFAALAVGALKWRGFTAEGTKGAKAKAG